VGPRAGLDRCKISRSPPGVDPRTVQPVASRYADCAISAHAALVQGVRTTGVLPLRPVYGFVTFVGRPYFDSKCEVVTYTSSFSLSTSGPQTAAGARLV
jgi:hypothetical protein